MLDNGNKKVIALGYFDSVHIGHVAVIDSAKRLAKRLGSSLTVFTFGGNLKKALSLADKTVVFTASERADVFEGLGGFSVLYASTEREFLSLSAKEFLDYLNAQENVVAYVCGRDYRFGVNGSGDVEFLMSYAKERFQTLEVVDIKTVDGKKVSTTLIKELLATGNVIKANELLGRDYFITGIVEKGRSVGKKLGFPTANISVNRDKTELKNGVYYGYGVLDGKKYVAVINYGAKPTFDVSAKNVEAHFIGFDGNLYGKEIKVFFKGYLRDIIKFKDGNALIEQLSKDVVKAKEFCYD